MLALALVPTLTLATVLESLSPAREADWPTTFAKMLAVTLVWAFSAPIGWRHGKWSEAFRKPPIN